MNDVISLLPPKQKEAALARIAKHDKAKEKAALTKDEAGQLESYGNIETTITRAAEILIIKKAQIAKSLSRPVERAQITNYTNAGCVARVYTDTRLLEIVRYSGDDDEVGTVVNKGVMP